MIRLLAIWNVTLTLALVAVLVLRFGTDSKVQAADTLQIIRTSRIEIVDPTGRTKATLGLYGNDSIPKLALLDNAGHEATSIVLNRRGYGTMFFRGRQLTGKVSLGYLRGSDSFVSDEEDPLSAWGIRVIDVDEKETTFGMTNDGHPIPHSSLQKK